MQTFQRTKAENFFVILILGLLTALSPFSIDMYLPAFPQIASDFHVSTAKVALTLSSYFIGLAVGQLLYGPLLDRFGRKKPMYAGIVIYVFASIGCVNSKSIDALVVFRFLQAVGGCATSVGAMAMVRDLFTVKESSKIFSLLILILGSSPLLAPTVGGYLTAAFGWHFVFYLLPLIAVGLIPLIYFYLPLTHLADRSISLRPNAIIIEFLNILAEPQFYAYAISEAIAFSGLFVYVASSPMIFMDIFKVDQKVYGWIFAFLSIGFIGSSQVNIWLVRKFSNQQLLQASMVSQFLIGILFLAAAFANLLSLPFIIIFLFFFLACAGMAAPNGSALALAPFEKNAGSAAALLGFIQMGIGSAVSMSVGFLDGHTLLPTVELFAATATLALIVLLIGQRRVPALIEVNPDMNSPVVH